jgi:hypothetical protein
MQKAQNLSASSRTKGTAKPEIAGTNMTETHMKLCIITVININCAVTGSNQFAM